MPASGKYSLSGFEIAMPSTCAASDADALARDGVARRADAAIVFVDFAAVGFADRDFAVAVVAFAVFAVFAFGVFAFGVFVFVFDSGVLVFAVFAFDVFVRALFGPAGAAPGAAAARSRTTSAAFLSSRRPMNDGWRSVPSLVHSVNAISATSDGFTQCTSRPAAPRGGSTTGAVFTSSGESFAASAVNVFVSKPVPTRPL